MSNISVIIVPPPVPLLPMGASLVTGFQVGDYSRSFRIPVVVPAGHKVTLRQFKRHWKLGIKPKKGKTVLIVTGALLVHDFPL